jgi:UDPglucose 6-dehydrogenase
MFASVGNRVTCVDHDPSIVEALRSNICTIHEPGLDEILRTARADSALCFTTHLSQAVEGADAVFIAVGTPSLESGAYDYRYVEQAARDIGQLLSPGRRTFVVLKSTVTPDIYMHVHSILTAYTSESGAEFELVSNPEFLAEGTAVRDFAQPHRVIVGVVSQEAREFMEALYAPFTKRKAGLMQFTDPKSAIVTKLAANGFLACRVALINELARYCDAVGADIECVRAGLASDPRIGPMFLYAGPGYGGSCFGKDIRALRESARENGSDLSLIPSIEKSNNVHKRYLPKKIEQYFGSVADKVIAVWGLSFKARTDDMRESPAIDAIEYLLARGARIQAHDPQALQHAGEYFGDRIKLFEDKYAALSGANALVIMTEWDAYKSPDFRDIRGCIADRVIFDGRNILEPAEVRKEGLVYIGIGRPYAKAVAATA